MITAIIRGERVTLEYGGAGWQGASPALMEKLEAVTENADIGGSDPAPDMTLARQAVAALGGRIVRASRPEGVPGRVYGSA